VSQLRRSFRIWQDPVVGSVWRWQCTFCHPPVCGYRTSCDAWEKILAVSAPRHFRVKRCHHAWVRRTFHTLRNNNYTRKPRGVTGRIAPIGRQGDTNGLPRRTLVTGEAFAADARGR
jgi:hypothetical protein